MIEPRRLKSKSRIAVLKGSSLENKENLGGNLSGKTKSVQRKNKNTSSKVKEAPDFEKLHKKWENGLAKKKATSKRPNTQIEPFNLTKSASKKENYFSDTEVDSDEDNEASERCLKEIKAFDITNQGSASCYDGKQYMTPAKQVRFTVPQSLPKGNSVKHKLKQDDATEFKSDRNALQSILDNVGVGYLETTPRKTKSELFSNYNKRPRSIYYTGPRPGQPPSKFEQRLSMILMRNEQKKQLQCNTTPVPCNPDDNEIELQKSHKFLETSAEKDECKTLTAAICYNVPSNVQSTDTKSGKIELSPNISWEETLKRYSRSNIPEKEDCDFLLAQMEKEVLESLGEIAVDNEKSNIDIALPTTLQTPNLTFDRSNVILTNYPIDPYGLQISECSSTVSKKLFLSPSVSSIDVGKQDIIDNDKAFLTKKRDDSKLTDVIESETVQNSSRSSNTLSLYKHEECFNMSNVSNTPKAVIPRNIESILETDMTVPSQIPDVQSVGDSLENCNINEKIHGLRNNISVSAFTPKSKHREAVMPAGNVINTTTDIMVPTPLRPSCNKEEKKNFDLRKTLSHIISRQQEIVQDTLVKSRYHAHEILLDAEVSLYTRTIEFSKKKFEFIKRLDNPLAKLLTNGDDMHFVPVND